MRGITRPCRHSLGPELHERWRSHLCGLCLTLREESGQLARTLTGYDVLLLSVLVEAQAGRPTTVEAGPCPLRGMQTAQVVPVEFAGVRLSASAALLAGAAGVEDKIRDGDLPAPLRPAGARAARRLAVQGRRLAAETGMDGDTMTAAATRASEAEASGGGLDELLAASGEAVAELFARTADSAGKPGNRDALARAGDAFGRLVHLIDAADDYRKDGRRGSFNPLAATSTPPAEAHSLARRLAGLVRHELDHVEMEEPDLARALLGPTLERSVEKAFRGRVSEPARRRRRWAEHLAGGVAAVAVPALVSFGIFGGRRRPPGGYYDPYGPPPPPGYGGYGYGYGGRRGPSCCDLLACDCCANLACDDCCGGNDDCCLLCC